MGKAHPAGLAFHNLGANARSGVVVARRVVERAGFGGYVVAHAFTTQFCIAAI